MKYTLYIFTLLFALTTMSCEDFLDVNTDPNNPVEVTPDLTLPVGQVFTAKYMQEDRGVNHLGNMMMFNWGESYGFSWYDDEFQYRVTTTFYDQLWDGFYEDALKQYSDLDNLAPEYVYYTAMGKIMKVFSFQILVDLYGDIPYSEALQRGENPTPAYDDAETIYLDLINELTEAVNLISSAEEGVAVEVVETGDIMFGGDMTQWIQFADTLKVRIPYPLQRCSRCCGHSGTAGFHRSKRSRFYFCRCGNTARICTGSRPNRITTGMNLDGMLPGLLP